MSNTEKYQIDYDLLTEQAKGLAESEPHFVPFLSNLSALIAENMPNLNWAGFYLMTRAGDLVLGPFQGKLACIHIAVGKGVCGTAIAENRTILVPDVHEFPGHIACDSASNSELVIPFRNEAGEPVAVLDLDSPEKERFSEEDAVGLEKLVRMAEKQILWDIQ
jgi:GAF domain-containing protein